MALRRRSELVLRFHRARKLKSSRRPLLTVVLGFPLLLACMARSAVLYEMHRVEKGETLASIAARYRVSVQQIREKNGFGQNRTPKVGETLVVPVVDGSRAEVAGTLQVAQAYEVAPGDTLTSIAKRFGASVDAILAKNNLTTESVLVPGQKLTVPISEDTIYRREPSRAATGEAPKTEGKPGKPTGAKEGVSTSAAKATAKKSTDPRVVGRLGTVTKAGGQIRRSPSPDGAALFKCSVGMQLVVADDNDQWCSILMTDGSKGWLSKKYVRVEEVELIADPNATCSTGDEFLVREAMRYLGAPYRYGGEGIGGMDCSGLVRRVFASRGLSLPRTAAEQSRVGYAVPYTQLRPGDRLYFANGGNINHTAIYIGNGQMIHASGGARCVTVDNLFSSKFWPIFIGARR